MTVSYVPGSGGGGGGGDASAANQVTGNNLLTAIDSKTGHESFGYAPGYTGSDLTGQLPGVDPQGQIAIRGPVLTDEGTFRVNFANTSLAVSIGSVTIVGDTVTGSGFLETYDIHLNDYFKLDADGESAWVQISSIVNDTTLVLSSSYVGGSSGAASRALMRPVTGSGGSISVASGQLTMTTGTTANAITRVTRNVDIPPMVYRARVSFSQRIANQTFRVGLSESFTISDRWFARFKFDGTTNTTVICETGRNPTTTPSASETESTTITLPNGVTSAVLNDYRVEVLTEKCNFFVNGVLVASHVKVIPAQHDDLEASVTCINGAVAPATTTTVVVDYVTGKNHNKLEIGVLSETEQIVANAPPMAEYSYSVAGVIAINTDLIVVDCLQLRSLYIHCSSMGTTGVVTAQWSNFPDFTGATTATLISETGATSTTFNAAVLRAVNVRARYFRLRLTTATTAGTTTIRVNGSQTDASPIIGTQPVSGTVTATVTGGTVLPVTPTTTFTNSAATNNAAVIKASAGTLWSVVAYNANAAARYVKFYNKATAPTVGTDVPVLVIAVPATSTVTVHGGSNGIRFGTGVGIGIVTGAADADNTAVAANEIKVATTYT